MSPGLNYRPNDEHMNVPIYRMRNLQDVEHAARLAREVIREVPRAERDPLAQEVFELLDDALDD